MSAEKPAGEMTFLHHLEELRWAILKSVLAILGGMILCFVVSTPILNFLIEPTRLESLGIELQSFKPAGMFTIRINVSLVVGFALALPFILFQLWHFVSPGLMETEKKYVPLVIFFSCILFLLGAAFAFYLLIPVMVGFFIEIYIPGVKAIWDIGFYIGLVNKMVLIMGIVFQMPMIVGFLTWIRILTYEFLRNSWRYALVIIFIAAAVITPTGDPYTQTLVAIPLVILFFISMGVSWLIGRGREKKSEDDKEDDEEDDDPTDAPAFEQPTSPDTPTISRGHMQYMGPEDDEFIYDYENEYEEKESAPAPAEDSGDQGADDTGDSESVGSQETSSEINLNESTLKSEEEKSKDPPAEGKELEEKDKEDDGETSSDLRK